MNDFLYEYKKRDIEDLAEFIADDYCPSGVIDLELIAKKNSIAFLYGDYGNYFDGLIEYYRNEFHIFINENNVQIRTEERKRFTFGHELGHYFIDNHRNALMNSNSSYHSSVTGFVTNNIMEKEADYFASCILIPYKRLLKECHKKKFDFQLLSSLAANFKSSLTATAIKIASKDIFSIMIISATDNKIDWYWCSNSFQFRRLKFGKEQVPMNTITGRFYKNGVKSEETQILRTEDIFHLNTQKDRERYFNEKCIYINANKTITFIWEYQI